jgi:adenine/guanine phosphoribosyltransferase-like PRPP-binding protein
MAPAPGGAHRPLDYAALPGTRLWTVACLAAAGAVLAASLALALGATLGATRDAALDATFQARP